MIKTFKENFNFFDTLDKKTLKQLEKEAYIANIPPGTSFMETGNRCDSVYFVIKGRLRVYKILPDGKEITLYRLGAGEMCLFSMSCFLNQMPLDLFAKIEVQSQLMVVSKETFSHLMAKDPSFQQSIMTKLLNMLSELLLLLEEVTFHSMNKRLANYLLTLLHTKKESTFKMTHESIAFELGTAREVISRLLKEFEKKEILSLSRGKIKIKSTELLTEIAEQ